MIYKIDGVNLSHFGAHPIPANGECIAISGIFNLPKRIGTTEYNWGINTEPFVDPSDIELNGRTLTLYVTIRKPTEKEFLTSLQEFKKACIACRKLYTEFGEFNVVCKDAIQVTRYPGYSFANLQVKFYQQEVSFPAINVKPLDGDVSLDGYSFEKCFATYINDFKKLEDIGKRIEVNTTLPFSKSEFREPIDMTLSCRMRGADLFSLYEKMQQLNALCIQPGLRTLKTRNKTVKLYFKNGISVKAISKRILSFDLKYRVTEWEN